MADTPGVSGWIVVATWLATVGAVVVPHTAQDVSEAAASVARAWPQEPSARLRVLGQRAGVSVVELRSETLRGPLGRWTVTAEGRVLLYTPGPEPDAEAWAQHGAIGFRRSPAEVLGAVGAAGWSAPAGSARPRRDPVSGRAGWTVDVRPHAPTLSRPVIWVDDATLRVHVGPDRTRFAEALAFLGNPVVTPEPQRFELTALPDEPTALADPRFDVRNCGDPGAPAFCELLPVPPSEAGDFVFEAPAPDVAEDHARLEDPFAAASIYVHADRWARFMVDQQLPWPPCVVDGEPGVLLANYRGFDGNGGVIPVANAGYTGDCELLAFFGQGPRADWGYDADVVVHELTHGVVEAQMGPQRVLGRTRARSEGVLDDAGAINEAIADFVAAVMADDPDHGEYVRAYDGGHLRSAANDLRCPDDLTGEIHFDAEPLTGALWEAYQDLGVELVGPVVDAIAMLPEDATFEEASLAFETLTRAELGEAAGDRLREALLGHNLVDCVRAAAASTRSRPLWLWPKSGSRGRFDPMRPPPLQVRFDAPQGRDLLTVTFDIEVVPDPGWAPVGDVHIVMQEGSPIDFSFDPDEDGGLRVRADPEQHLPSVNEGRFELRVTPGTSSYVAFFNQGLHLTRISNLQAEFSEAPAMGGGSSSTGGSGDDSSSGSEAVGSGETGSEPPALDDDGGCACGVGRRRGPGLAWCLVLGLRRRRRATGGSAAARS